MDAVTSLRLGGVAAAIATVGERHFDRLYTTISNIYGEAVSFQTLAAFQVIGSGAKTRRLYIHTNCSLSIALDGTVRVNNKLVLDHDSLEPVKFMEAGDYVAILGENNTINLTFLSLPKDPSKYQIDCSDLSTTIKIIK